MNRRKFLKASVLTGMAVSIPGGMDLLLSKSDAAESPELAVVQGASAPAAVKAAFDALGGVKKFIAGGDIVVLKPNIGWDRTPEYAANTNPEVVAAVVRLCIDAGAKKVKVFDRSCADERRSYKQSGIADAARAAGAEVSFVDDRKFKSMSLGGHALKAWPLYRDVFEADKVINLPIAKVHGLSTVTLGMKNWMGVMGGNRGELHRKLDESLVDISMKIKPAVTILDAVRILTNNGPQGGDLRDVKRLNTVVAGIDQVSVDAYGASLFGLKPRSIGHIAAAHKAGLGEIDLKKVRIKKIAL